MEKQKQDQNNSQPNKNSPLLRKIGIFLLAASFVLYGGILIVPFTPFSGNTRIIMGTTLAVLGEICFWIGGIILGKEFVSRYKKYLNPFHWLKKKGD